MRAEQGEDLARKRNEKKKTWIQVLLRILRSITFTDKPKASSIQPESLNFAITERNV